MKAGQTFYSWEIVKIGSLLTGYHLAKANLNYVKESRVRNFQFLTFKFQFQLSVPQKHLHRSCLGYQGFYRQ